VLADAQNALTSASDDVAKAEAQIAIEVRTVIFFSHCFSYDSFSLTADHLIFLGSDQLYFLAIASFIALFH
jgi:hypothetical protein